MADPLEKKVGTWTTPVFWFLKGVEGFDTSRANDCAKKLNDKHYDTIAVLKLAEKRDLIEDAGILPGDALRIVVAARAYVAPASAPCEPPFRHGASPRPVKRYQKHPSPSEPQHHHDAITTALESLKVYQAACMATANLTPARASDSTSQAKQTALEHLKAYQAACIATHSLTPARTASDSTSLQQPGASQSTFQAFQAWGSDLTLRALPQQQQRASIFQSSSPGASDSTAIPQQPPPGISYGTFRASPEQKGAAVSQQVAPKSEAVKDPTSTIQAVPHQQQPSASVLTFKAVSHQQQPGASDSTFQSVPQQQPPKAPHLTFQAVPQQQTGAAVSQQVAPKLEPVTDPTVPLPSTIQPVPQQQQPGASDSILEAVPQQQPGVSDFPFQMSSQLQKGAAVSRQVSPKSEAVKDPLPSIIQAAFPQEQPRASVPTFKAVPQQPGASDSAPQQQQQLRPSIVTFRAVPQQQQQAKASDPILQASLQAPIEERHASFQAYLQELHGAAASQQVAPKSEPVKNPTVPLPSTTQAVSQQQAMSSDPIVQAVPQPGASNTTLRAVPQQQTKASNTTPQASPQQQPKASVATSQTSPQQQARASDSIAQSVPVVSDSTTQGVSQQQQQQPRLSDPILQASLQATLQKQNASFEAYVQQLHQPRASDSTVQVVSQPQPRASDATTQSVSQQQQLRTSDSILQTSPQQPRASSLTSQPFLQQQPRASDSTSQAVFDGWGRPQKLYGESCNGFESYDYGYHGSSEKDNFSDAFGYLGGVRVKPSHLVKYPHICRLCNVKCIGEKQYITHYSCQRHYEALDIWEARNPPQAATQPHSEHPPRSGNGTPEYVCGVCDIWCRSENDLRSHFNGNKHAKNMKLAIDSQDNRHTTYLYCSVCDVLCNSKWNLVQHLNGKRHAQNMEEDYPDEDYSEGSSYYSEYS